jgi:hypothetical protein
LVLDLKNKPFINVRLMYDLYDYKEYGAFTNGIDEEIISSNRDGNLYCRGLRIEDDSTFPGTGACDQADETCLYAYAKVNDKGLTKRNGATYVSTTPTLPQTEIEGNGYSVDSDDYFVKKCLPENAGLIRPNDPITPASEVLTLSGWRANALTIGTQNYVYEGPYKANNVEEWQISGNALLGSKGIFKSFFNGTGLYDSADTFIEQKGEQSYLFPRYTKMELASGVENLSSSGAANASPKSLDSFPSSGSTGWMDGCNKRVQSVNPVGEHIGSCNVTAKIEVLTKDADGVEFIVDDTKDVVLQLVRPTQMSVENGDVLYSNFKSCVNSSQCNQNECCFNQRCWSNSLVTQCLESATNVGNLGNGENCTSDYECSSLCCRNNTCNVHNNMLSPPVLCSKPVGNFCIAREWCQPQPVQNCYVVLTGTSATGQTMCEKRCYMTSELGDCRNGVCIAPPPGATADDFDPEDPDACIDAIPIPNFP